MATRRWRRCCSLNSEARRTEEWRMAVVVVGVEVAEAVVAVVVEVLVKEVLAAVVEARVGVGAVGAAGR